MSAMPDPLTNADLDRLDALCAAAAWGPWDLSALLGQRIERPGLWAPGCVTAQSSPVALKVDDLVFLESARTETPRLIAEVRALRRALACMECNRSGHRGSGTYDGEGSWSDYVRCPCGKAALIDRIRGEPSP